AVAGASRLRALLVKRAAVLGARRVRRVALADEEDGGVHAGGEEPSPRMARVPGHDRRSAAGRQGHVRLRFALHVAAPSAVSRFAARRVGSRLRAWTAVDAAGPPGRYARTDGSERHGHARGAVPQRPRSVAARGSSNSTDRTGKGHRVKRRITL